MSEPIHIPVLAEEIIEFLQPRSGDVFIDGTLNGGGHARLIAKKVGPGGRVIGIERDHSIAKRIAAEHIKGLVVVEGNYKDMERITKKQKAASISGVLFDFGMSSWHVDASGRGFSFSKDEPLDMRYATSEGVTAAEVVNTSSERDLEYIFREYGEERFSRHIAHAIAVERKKGRIVTSGRLADIVSRVIKVRAGGIHPATRIFQALRIAVNQELENVEAGLAAAMSIVRPGGRVAAISFHSLEDRIVKHTFQGSVTGRVVTKKPVMASRAEIIKNPRSRSAKLRVWEKLA